MSTAMVVVALLVILLCAWAIESCPMVDPDHCPLFEAIRHGREECGGPCTDARPLPCACRRDPEDVRT